MKGRETGRENRDGGEKRDKYKIRNVEGRNQGETSKGKGRDKKEGGRRAHWRQRGKA